VKVAAISRPGDEVSSLGMIKSGSRACLANSISAIDLAKSIKLVSSGPIMISPAFAERSIGEIASSKSVDKEKEDKVESVLSEREMEIVRLIAEGVTDKEISEKLIITENTMKMHVRNILNKLELHNQ
jgi:DNA-binding NarL/FixJ family response regulator